MSKQCGNCGAWQEDTAKFCDNCGSSMAQLQVEPETVEVIIEPPRRSQFSPGVDAREVRERLVGSKTEYYLPRFEKMENLNSFTSWNWCACLFGVSWMMYRKMYIYGFVMWLMIQFISAVNLSGLNLLFWIGSGILGNFLYMKDINNRTEKAMNMQPEEREVYIEKNSGTGWMGVIIMFIVTVLLGAAVTV